MPVKYVREAFGESKNLRAWARDPRCPVSHAGLYHRVIVQGMSVEQAFAKGGYDPKVKKPGGAATPRKVTAWGETKTIAEWAADPRARVKAATIASRITRGRHTPEQAITLGHYESRPPEPIEVLRARAALAKRHSG